VAEKPQESRWTQKYRNPGEAGAKEEQAVESGASLPLLWPASSALSVAAPAPALPTTPKRDLPETQNQAIGFDLEPLVPVRRLAFVCSPVR
jgi:hypothetical protein